jgi:hypothetical protein
VFEMKKINGWCRLGIVLSILWFISFGLWLQDNIADSSSLGNDYAYCLKRYDPDLEAFIRDHPWLQEEPVFSTKFQREWKPYTGELRLKEADCKDRAHDNFKYRWSFAWIAAPTIAAMSVTLMWLVALITVAAVRWIAAGFRRANP